MKWILIIAVLCLFTVEAQASHRGGKALRVLTAPARAVVNARSNWVDVRQGRRNTRIEYTSTRTTRRGVRGIICLGGACRSQ